MKEKKITAVRVGVLLLAALFFAVLHWILREKVPERQVRLAVLACTAGISGASFFWVRFHHRQVALFADDICEMLDALMAGQLFSIRGFFVCQSSGKADAVLRHDEGGRASEPQG